MTSHSFRCYEYGINLSGLFCDTGLKMKLFIVFLCVALFIIESFGAAFLEINQTNPSYPNKCYQEGPPLIIMDLDTSKRATGGDCAKWTCRADYSLYYETCSVYLKRIKYCRSIAGDLSKPYPDCCPEYVC